MKAAARTPFQPVPLAGTPRPAARAWASGFRAGLLAGCVLGALCSAVGVLWWVSP